VTELEDEEGLEIVEVAAVAPELGDARLPLLREVDDCPEAALEIAAELELESTIEEGTEGMLRY